MNPVPPPPPKWRPGERERFELVKIAFKEQLRCQLPNIPDWVAFGQQVIGSVDGVLAEMEKPGGTGPVRRQTLLAIHCIVQRYRDSRLSYYGRNPAGEDQREIGNRDGVQHTYNAILDLIDAEIEMGKPEAETDDA